MIENQTYCEYCEKDVEFRTNNEQISSNLKGEEYTYNGKKAFCKECENEIYVHDVNDYNLEKLYDEFRKSNNIISLDQINEIPDKYNIGKRPLSLLLGWGEQTFSRYLNGDMPTQQYSEILQKIYDDPAYYLNILESNKENLRSPKAYEKSKDATLKLLKSPLQSDSNAKIDEVVNYLIYKCEDITPLALQKLLYYVQGFYYAFVGRFIFEEDCEAWVHGPVYKDIYFKYKEYRYDPIDQKFSEINFENSLSVSEKTIIDSVIKHLSCYSGKMLESFTHSESPWLQTRGNLPSIASTNKRINKNLISQYFKAVKEKNNMLNPSDIGEYSRKMFFHID
ncbi:type II TA system antitoxin MqsA family protein [Haloplasma contractile]|uniref:NAD transhydrogenase subunit alpha protein n=1 Tax=Haloplasma contractile SSD-17B TaxID=1033810 RepID=U2DR80_9MOLU|nr:type II TA system antitoxin MqsA family protein [Haloplasma contractile]ERJ11082.1 NAD transhydrogenase subunit alpha protein [Haloplasma contractile SSD-17B]